MISSGYFKVPEDIINWDKEKAKRFLWEMLNCGGRISAYEYQRWLEKIERPKYKPTKKDFEKAYWGD